MKYSYCLNHPNRYAVNAKCLCGVCTKERHEKSAKSKGLTIKKKDDGTDNTRRTEKKSDEQLQNKRKALVFKKQAKKTKVYKINTISKDKATELRRLSEIKKSKIRIQGSCCELCGKSGEVDLFHIIGVGDKKHSTNPLNTLLSCRWCHLVWGANDWSKVVKFRNFDEIMSRLKSLNEGKYWKLWHKIEKHVIEQYFKTGDKTEIDRLGIKFEKPL